MVNHGCATQADLTRPGLEPGISGSGGRRLIHEANGPIAQCRARCTKTQPRTTRSTASWRLRSGASYALRAQTCYMRLSSQRGGGSARSAAASYKPPMLVTRVRPPACTILAGPHGLRCALGQSAAGHLRLAFGLVETHALLGAHPCALASLLWLAQNYAGPRRPRKNNIRNRLLLNQRCLGLSCPLSKRPRAAPELNPPGQSPTPVLTSAA